jgi:hypothetical protein
MGRNLYDPITYAKNMPKLQVIINDQEAGSFILPEAALNSSHSVLSGRLMMLGPWQPGGLSPNRSSTVFHGYSQASDLSGSLCPHLARDSLSNKSLVSYILLTYEI